MEANFRENSLAEHIERLVGVKTAKCCLSCRFLSQETNLLMGSCKKHGIPGIWYASVCSNWRIKEDE